MADLVSEDAPVEDVDEMPQVLLIIAGPWGDEGPRCGAYGALQCEGDCNRVSPVADIAPSQEGVPQGKITGHRTMSFL